MIDPQSHADLKAALAARIGEDSFLLDQLREEIRPLAGLVRRIQPRQTTAISLVATDGGNNQVQFDPFLIQLVRVVDSSNNEHYLDVITPSTNIDELTAAQFQGPNGPTALGQLMTHLGLSHLSQLSYQFPGASQKQPPNIRWVEVYRELVEWAVLFSIIHNHSFGSDTLIVFDGLLRSKASF